MQAGPSPSHQPAQAHVTSPSTALISNDTPQPALQTTKRKFHKLLDTLTKPSKKRPHESSFLPFSGVDSPAKRIRLEARSRLDAAHQSSLSSSTSQPQRALSPQQSLRAEARAKVDAQLLRSRLEAARPSSSRSRHSINISRPSTPAKEPNYNPYSHTGFLRRLQTYAPVHLWSAKPPPINEVAWSCHGWICVDTNTVACKGGCEERVVVSLRPPLKNEAQQDIEGSEDLSHEVPEQLVEKVAKLLVGGHEENCLWRTAGGCKDDIYRLPVARQIVWEPDLKERYGGFVRAKKGGARVPDGANVESPLDVGRLGSMLPPGFTEQQDTQSNPGIGEQGKDSDTDEDALAFALMGWSLSQDSTTEYPLATCSACFRRLGLWMYTSTLPIAPSTSTKDSEPASTAPSPSLTTKTTIIDLDDSDEEPSQPTSNTNPNYAEAAANARQPTSTLSLNLLTCHREYCPWISAHSQHMTGSLAGLSGYEVLARCIENAHRFRLRGEGRDLGGGLGSHPVSKPTSGDGTSRPVSGGGTVGTRVDGADDAPDEGARDEAEAGDGGAVMPEKSKEEQADEDRARFARLRALTKTLKLKGLRMKLTGKAYN